MDTYFDSEKKCSHCQSPILFHGEKFCSRACAASFNNLIRKSKRQEETCLECGTSLRGKQGKNFCSSNCHKKYEFNKNVENWLAGNDCGFKGKAMQIKNFVRQFLLQEADFKCCKCGWDEKNPITKTAPLEINHIDGNAENCSRNNLEVLCPNCHSLTPNFRRLNKVSKRKR